MAQKRSTNKAAIRSAAAASQVINAADAPKKPTPVKNKGTKTPRVVGGAARRKQIASEVPAGFHEFLQTLPKDHPFHDLAKKDPVALGREIARMKEIAKGKTEASAGRAAVSGAGQKSQAQFDPESMANQAVRARRAARKAGTFKEEAEPTVEVVQPAENRGRVVPLSGEAARQAIEIARSKGKPEKAKRERKPGLVETGLTPNTLFGGNELKGGQGRTIINRRQGY
jgi:hypothetical protein